MENKKTAVEWLIEQLIPKDQHKGIADIIDEALQMEKEQMEDVWHDSRVEDFGDDYIGKQISFNDYYNETFKTKNQKPMSKQTAVKWLYNHLFPKQLDGYSEEEWSKIDKAFEQAKQMEKEQIIDAHNHGFTEGTCFGASPISYTFIKSEEYYNENFKTKEK